MANSDGYNSFAIGMSLAIIGIIGIAMGWFISSKQEANPDGTWNSGTKIAIGGIGFLVVGSLLIYIGNKKG